MNIKIEKDHDCSVCAPRNAVYRAEIERLNAEVEQLRTLSVTDELTGLPNRRFFEEHLRHATASAVRNQLPLCIVLCDIDDFKLINNAYTQVGGDSMLKQVAMILRRACRSEDEVARVGGEEFAFILHGTDAEAAMIPLNRLRSMMAQHHFLVVGNTYSKTSPTLSIGVAERDMGETPADTYARAAEALRKAKTSGKNKICIA